MSVETILRRLNKTRKTGHNKWQGCCPAHDDNSPSLCVRELDDGRVLIHCFAGCATSEILHAIDLDFRDLFPEPSAFHYPKVRKPWNAGDVLSALAMEILIVWNIANKMAHHEVLNEDDYDRLLLSATRLQRGLEVANG